MGGTCTRGVSSRCLPTWLVDPPNRDAPAGGLRTDILHLRTFAMDPVLFPDDPPSPKRVSSSLPPSSSKQSSLSLTQPFSLFLIFVEPMTGGLLPLGYSTGHPSILLREERCIQSGDTRGKGRGMG